MSGNKNQRKGGTNKQKRRGRERERVSAREEDRDKRAERKSKWQTCKSFATIVITTCLSVPSSFVELLESHGCLCEPPLMKCKQAWKCENAVLPR